MHLQLGFLVYLVVVSQRKARRLSQNRRSADRSPGASHQQQHQHLAAPVGVQRATISEAARRRSAPSHSQAVGGPRGAPTPGGGAPSSNKRPVVAAAVAAAMRQGGAPGGSPSPPIGAGAAEIPTVQHVHGLEQPQQQQEAPTGPLSSSVSAPALLPTAGRKRRSLPAYNHFSKLLARCNLLLPGTTAVGVPVAAAAPAAVVVAPYAAVPAPYAPVAASAVVAAAARETVKAEVTSALPISAAKAVHDATATADDGPSTAALAAGTNELLTEAAATPAAVGEAAKQEAPAMPEVEGPPEPPAAEGATEGERAEGATAAADASAAPTNEDASDTDSTPAGDSGPSLHPIEALSAAGTPGVAEAPPAVAPN